jgi:hypothetical protein
MLNWFFSNENEALQFLESECEEFLKNKHQLQREANSIPKLKLLDQLMND